MKAFKEIIEAARRLVEEQPELYQALADNESGETLTPEEHAMLDADIAAPESKLRELSRLAQEFGGCDSETDEKLREESFVRAMTCCSRGPCGKHR